MIKRYCILLYSVMLFSFNSYGVNTYSYLWVTDKNASGDLSYTGPALTNITGSLGALYTGTMRIAYVDCSTTANKYVGYSGLEYWIFIPSSISMNGVNVLLTPETPTGYTSAGKLSSGEYVFNKYISKTAGGVLGACGTIGNTWPMNYTYPTITIKANVSGLSAGTYTGTFPVKMAYGEYFTENSASDISRFSSSLAYNYATVLQIPYNINITNTCQVSPSNMTIDHGQFGIGQGNGNVVRKDFSIACENTAQITIDFQPLTAPTKSYTNGVGVGLGNGFDTVVQIGSLGLSNASTSKTIQIPKGVTTIPLISTIHENNNSSVGTLYGTANLNLTIK
ncbi:protein PapG [Escherichia coli]|uniref:PapG chaperone-binding domain-containing protein n=1 Tax=Escherichia coli TaxID=562 RepID=UPI0019198D45|nr:PapG chaperone-binding domain-containing protein [Escherichia coli]CAD5644363.1 protein PapG [Escherichia coli]CAD5645220.1 protein PapG [Escherichia coli]